MSTWSEFDGDATFLADEVDRLRTALMLAEEGLNAEIAELETERDSLRGVVQAVEATVKAYSDGAMPNMREFVHQLRAALAAAADAPQPAASDFCGTRAGEFQGWSRPSPAVLPSEGK